MIGYRVQNLILNGTLDGEEPVDVFYMCLTAALIHVRKELEYQSSQAYRIEFAESLNPALELMGKILCPIYEVVKPDDYVAKMSRARQEFAGIATSGELQYVFTEQILMLENERLLDGLDRAVEAQVWRFLRPPNAEPMLR